MRSEPTYLAARLVASTVQKHFAQHLCAAQLRGEVELAPEPDIPTIEGIIDTAFWASMRKEEGNNTRVSLAFLPPDHSASAIQFSHRLPLRPDILTKLSPGVERAGIYVGVWIENDSLYVWGTTSHIPKLCFVLDVSEPGLIVIKHKRSNGFGKFTNVAVLKGDQVKVIDERYAVLPDSPGLVRALLGQYNPNTDLHSMNVLVQLAVSMRKHNRGGSLLVVPAGSDLWKQSIIHPIKYAVEPAYSGLAALMKMTTAEKESNEGQKKLLSELDSIGGLTAIDGATLVNDQYELLAFGAKIGKQEGNPRIEKIMQHEPIIGDSPRVINPTQSGGTRHLSAAQFVHDQHDAIALVASQDGHFTIFTWSPDEAMVLACRIDSLLL